MICGITTDSKRKRTKVNVDEIQAINKSTSPSSKKETERKSQTKIGGENMWSVAIIVVIPGSLSYAYIFGRSKWIQT